MSKRRELLSGWILTACFDYPLQNVILQFASYLYEKDVSKRLTVIFLEKSLTLLYLPIRKIIDKSIFWENRMKDLIAKMLIK